MDVYRVIYKKSIRKTRVRDVRRTAFASARWERQTGVRGVPSSQALAWTKVILPLSASSRQLSEACETPAVRRVSSKTRTPRGCPRDSEARSESASVPKRHASPYHRTHYDARLMRLIR